MKNSTPVLWGISLALTCGILAAAQDASTPQLAKVLQITREYIKAGHHGAAHDRSESAFVQALGRAKSPTHYVALNSMSGKSRAIYMTRYDSLEALEQDAKFVEKNSVLAADLDRAEMMDGEHLEAVDQAVFLSVPELSFHIRPQLADARYLEISTYVVKPGHEAEWRALVKLVQAAYEKAGTGAHWGMYELRYGGRGGTYLVLSSKKSLSEVDSDIEDGKKFGAVVGEDGMKKLDELDQACIESSSHELFSVNARQSYPDEAWVKADPTFWRAKPANMATAKVAKPPAPVSTAPKPASR